MSGMVAVEISWVPEIDMLFANVGNGGVSNIIGGVFGLGVCRSTILVLEM